MKKKRFSILALMLAAVMFLGACSLTTIVKTTNKETLSETQTTTETEPTKNTENTEIASSDVPDTSVIPEEPPVSADVDQAYCDVLEEHLSDVNGHKADKHDLYSDGSIFLYDIDGDSVEELVIFASYPDAEYEGMRSACYSVYDYENNQLVEKVYKERVFYEAGGPGGKVSVAEYNGKTVIVVTSNNGETSGNAHRVATISIYDGKTFSLEVDAKKDYNCDERGNVQFNFATINDKSATQSEYNRIENSINYIVTAEYYENDSADGSQDFYELINYYMDILY